jgi:SAM-dependent methyltransferase
LGSALENWNLPGLRMKRERNVEGVNMTNPWDERYRTQEYYYGTEPNDFLKENAWRIPSNGKVLCLAEGEGRNAVYLAGLGFEVTAVDGSRVGLEKLSKLAHSKGVRVQTVVSDLNEFNLGLRQWDGIVSIWCHVPPLVRGKLHRQVVDGLRLGGAFLLESYHPRQLEYKTGGPPSADLMMTKDSLSRELDGLEFELLREFDRDVHEGRGHKGKSAVVQCVARRKER